MELGLGMLDDVDAWTAAAAVSAMTTTGRTCDSPPGRIARGARWCYAPEIRRPVRNSFPALQRRWSPRKRRGTTLRTDSRSSWSAASASGACCPFGPRAVGEFSGVTKGDARRLRGHCKCRTPEPSSEARGLAPRPSPQDCPVAAGATLANRAAGVVTRIRKQRCDNRIGRRIPIAARRFRYHRLRDAIRQSGGQRAGSASLRSEWWRTRTSRPCRPPGWRTSAATHARSARSPGLRTFRRAGFHRTRAEVVLTPPVLMGSGHPPTTGSPGRARSCPNCWAPQGLSEEQVAPPALCV